MSELIDATQDQSDLGSLTATVAGHRSAGADHVILSTRIGSDYDAGLDRLKELAPQFVDQA
jgi:hypothetical protein